MTDLTSERLAELRRIAEAATPGPWRSSGFLVHSNFGAIICDVRINANALHIATFNPTTVLALLNRVEELSLACAAALRVLVAAGLFEQDEDGNITADTRFYDDLCKLANAARYVADYATDGLVAESEACLRHQFDVARAEAEALRKRIEALEAENERLRQIEAAARTLVDTAFEVPGPDEYVYQAVRVDHFDMLAALLKGEGGATHA